MPKLTVRDLFARLTIVAEGVIIAALALGWAWDHWRLKREIEWLQKQRETDVREKIRVSETKLFGSPHTPP
jgi:hypothetical protein